MNRHNKTAANTNAVTSRPAPPKKAEKPAPTYTYSERPSVTYSESTAEPEPSSLNRKYAEILDVKPKEITNYELYSFIDRWYGTRHRIGGSDRNGIDCSGFVQKLYSEVYGMDLLRTSMEQFSSCKRIKRIENAEEGDLVFFRVHSKRITHVGMYLTNNFFVHSSTSGGVMISNLNEEYWHKYYAGMGRVPKG
jgi:lipoprotein Spr